MNEIKRVSKKCALKVSETLLFIMLTSQTFAALPKPPDGDMANSSRDWIETGAALVNKLLGYAAIALAAIILMGVAGGIIKAYQVSQEKGELSHFFKMLVVGLLVAAAGLGLVYAGHEIVKV